MASNLRIASVGESEVLLYSTDRQMTGLFLQATIIKSDGDILNTVNLTENSNVSGEYQGTVTINTAGVYDVLYIPYTNSGHTTESERAPRASEVWNVRLTADKFAGARPGATIEPEVDIKQLAKDLKKELGKPKEEKEDIRGIIEEVINRKLKEIDFKPKIEVKTPDIIVKPTPVIVKPIVNVKAPIVHPTPITVKPIIKPTPVTVKAPDVNIEAPIIKIDAPIVKPTSVTVKSPIVNPTPVNIDLSKIENKQEQLKEILESIASDITNIKQKEGIVGTSQRIFNKLIS